MKFHAMPHLFRRVRIPQKPVPAMPRSRDRLRGDVKNITSGFRAARRCGLPRKRFPPCVRGNFRVLPHSGNVRRRRRLCLEEQRIRDHRVVFSRRAFSARLDVKRQLAHAPDRRRVAHAAVRAEAEAARECALGSRAIFHHAQHERDFFRAVFQDSVRRRVAEVRVREKCVLRKYDCALTSSGVSAATSTVSSFAFSAPSNFPFAIHAIVWSASAEICVSTVEAFLRPASIAF